MGGGKTDALDAVYVGDQAEQFGKAQFFGAFHAVGVHVLPQEGHLPDTDFRQLANFLQYLAGTPADLPAPHVGNDAVGAEIIAALYDGYKAGDTAGRLFAGEKVKAGLVVEKSFRVSRSPFSSCANHVRQQVQGVCSEDKIEIGNTLEKALAFLLGNATSYTEEHFLLSISSGFSAAPIR